MSNVTIADALYQPELLANAMQAHLQANDPDCRFVVELATFPDDGYVEVCWGRDIYGGRWRKIEADKLQGAIAAVLGPDIDQDWEVEAGAYCRIWAPAEHAANLAS